MEGDNCGWKGHRASECKWPAKKQQPTQPMDVNTVQKADPGRAKGDKGQDTKAYINVILPAKELKADPSDWECVLNIEEDPFSDYRGGFTEIIEPQPVGRVTEMIQAYEIMIKKNIFGMPLRDPRRAYLEQALSYANGVVTDEEEKTKADPDLVWQAMSIVRQHFERELIVASDTDNAADAKDMRKQILNLNAVTDWKKKPKESNWVFEDLTKGMTLEEYGIEADDYTRTLEELKSEEVDVENTVGVIGEEQEETLLDSGAVEHCAPQWFSTSSPLQKGPSPGLCSASGARLKYYGKRDVKFGMNGEHCEATGNANGRASFII